MCIRDSGIGGRDLKAEVGGITMMDMIDAMEDDDTVKVLAVSYTHLSSA